MLVLPQRPNKSLVIELADGVESTLTLKDLFADGPIEVTLLGIDKRQFKMGIIAPPELSIRRKFE